LKIDIATSRASTDESGRPSHSISSRGCQSLARASVQPLCLLIQMNYCSTTDNGHNARCNMKHTEQYKNIGMSLRSSCTLRRQTKCRAAVPKRSDVPERIDPTWARRCKNSRQRIGGASGDWRPWRERRCTRGDRRARCRAALHQGGCRCVASCGGGEWRELRSWDGGWGRWLSEWVICREGIVRTAKPWGQHNYDSG
jgi:hypothetical protein